MIISPEERAHDLADKVAHWQLTQIEKRIREENKKAKVNLHACYRKYYTELLSVFKQDSLFNEELQNAESVQK